MSGSLYGKVHKGGLLSGVSHLPTSQGSQRGWDPLVSVPFGSLSARTLRWTVGIWNRERLLSERRAFASAKCIECAGKSNAAVSARLPGDVGNCI